MITGGLGTAGGPIAGGLGEGTGGDSGASSTTAAPTAATRGGGQTPAGRRKSVFRPLDLDEARRLRDFYRREGERRQAGKFRRAARRSLTGGVRVRRAVTRWNLDQVAAPVPTSLAEGTRWGAISQAPEVETKQTRSFRGPLIVIGTAALAIWLLSRLDETATP